MESTKGVSTYHFSEETAGAKKNDTLARKPFDLVCLLPRWSGKEKLSSLIMHARQHLRSSLNDTPHDAERDMPFFLSQLLKRIGTIN